MPSDSNIGSVVIPFKAATAAETRFRFTRERIARATKPLLRLPKPFTLYDTDVPGLILRRQSGAAMAYYVTKRVNGRLHYIRLAQHAANVDLDAVRAEARDIIHRLHTGTYLAEQAAAKADKAAGLDTLTAETLVAATASYIASSNPPLKADTAANYKIAAARICGVNKNALAEMPLSAWSSQNVREAFDALTREVSAATASGYMRAARAVVEGWRWRHPEARIPAHNVVVLGMKMGTKSKWVTAKPRKGSLKAAEVPAFISKAREFARTSNGRSSMFRLAEFLALTGLRFKEAARLEWAEVDLAGGMLHIAANRMKAGHAFDKPLGKAAVAVLKLQQEGYGSGTYVFPSNTKPGTPIDDARQAMAEICGGDLTRVTPHDLRRGYIRAATNSGLPRHRVKALVAHSIGTDVTDGYLGIGSDDPHADAQRVEDHLAGGAQ